jgi:Ni,Fe-hydrogenase III small subunit/formate hydrogenlyase subunit 6/NADH:ubiquinone oxidoreductase subunit I
MFKILQKTLATGIATVEYPAQQAVISPNFRGRPAFDFPTWSDARPAAAVCPTGAIALAESNGKRRVTVDYGRCTYCGQCAEVSADGAVRITGEFEMAARKRASLVVSAEYTVQENGTHGQWIATTKLEEDVAAAGGQLSEAIQRTLGRALAIRQVDAGSCNGCELEIGALNSPIHDVERFGIHFVASPRHADMLLVTGPVTLNMETALRKTWAATPDPKVTVAVGACGISGGIFGTSYASRGGVDSVIPVDVYIPGCPPRPEALLHGILLAVGRLGKTPR